MRISFALICIIAALNVYAYDFVDSSGIAYDINNADLTATVTFKDNNYNNYSGNVIIPATVPFQGSSYTVNAIGDNAFRNCQNLTSITIGDNITSLGKRAFYACNKLNEITITPAVIAIGDYAFSDCSSLKHVNMSNNQPITIGVAAFMRCENLTNVNWISYNKLEGLGGVTSIETNAFASCYSLSEIMIPGNLQRMGSTIFNGCNSLNTITMMSEKPFSLKSDAFAIDASQVTIKVPMGIKAGNTARAYMQTNSWQGYTIAELPYSFIDNDYYTYHKTSSNSIELTGCNKAVNNVKVRNNIIDDKGDKYYITAIANQAFKRTEITGLDTSTTLKLDSIGTEAFAYCTNLSQVLLIEGLATMGSKAFTGCTSIQQIKIPSTLHVVPNEAFMECTNLSDLTLLHGVLQIDDNAFAHCTSITQVKLPRSVNKVSSLAFSGDFNLEYIDVDAESSFFTSVEGVLVELKHGEEFLEEELGEMDKLAIYPINKTESNFYIPCGISHISDYAFKDARNLKHLAVPPTIKTFGLDCFDNTHLEIINFRATEPVTVNNGALDDVNASTLIQVPVQSKPLYNNATPWSRFTNVTERYDVYHDNCFAYDWDNDDNIIIIDIKTPAVNNGVLEYPLDITLSSVEYITAGLKNTSTANVATSVKSLNLSNVGFAYIDTSDGINPLATLSQLESISISEDNPNFKLIDDVLLNFNENILYYYLRTKTDEQFNLFARVDTIMPQAFAANSHLQYFISNSKLKIIDAGAFENCNSLNKVKNASTVTFIGDKAFKGCPLSVFNGGDKLTCIGIEAFEGCDNLYYFPLAHGVIKSIGDRAFKDCSSLKNVTLPITLSDVGNNVFENCNNLIKTYFSSTITKMGTGIFKGCTSLNELWFCNNTPPTIDADMFEGINLQNAKLMIPQESFNSYSSDAYWGKFGEIKSSNLITNGADVNCDKSINTIDVSIIYSYILGMGMYATVGQMDVNRDGAVNASDITLIYRCILDGIEPMLSFKFENQDGDNIQQDIIINSSHQYIKALDQETDEYVKQGFYGDFDNDLVINLGMASINGIPHIEIIPISEGYAALVAIVNKNNTLHYRIYSLKIIQ